MKRDSTALVAVAWDRSNRRVQLIAHRIFQPSSEQPLDFEACVESTVKAWRDNFVVRGVYYDPYQMAAVSQRLQSAGVPMREYNQSPANLTVMGNNLYEIIKGRNLAV